MEEEKSLKEGESKEVSEEFSDCRVLSVDEVFVLAGGFEKYQHYAAGSMIVALTSCVLFAVYLPRFLSLPPLSSCLSPENKECLSKEEACRTGAYAYQRQSLNFVSEFDLLCDSARSSLVFYLFVLGSAMGCALASCWADIFGRILAVFAGQTGIILSALLLLLLPNYYVCLAAAAVMGFCSVGTAAPALCHALESMEERHGSWLCALAVALCLFAANLIDSLYYFQAVEWRHLMIGLIVWSSLFYLPFFQLQQSPRFLLHSGRKTQAMQSLKKIAETNSRLLPEKIQLASDDSQLLEKLKTLKEIWRYLCKSGRLRQMAIFGVIYASLGFCLFRWDAEAMNPYQEALFSLLSFASVLAGHYLAQKMGKRLGLMIALFCAGLVYYLQEFGIGYGLGLYPHLIKLLLFISAFSALNYSVEMIPVSIRCSSLGICLMFTLLGAACSFAVVSVPGWVLVALMAFSLLCVLLIRPFKKFDEQKTV